MASPSISLCIIVKDEEELLPGAIESVKGLVDQIVVVDTGSVDRSVEIAEAAGAIVVLHRWTGDFAAARNAALGHVTSDWILVLDADERLASGSFEAIRKAVNSGVEFHCGMLPLHNATELEASFEDVVAGKSRIGEPVLLPRLLRMDSDLKWAGVVHESVGKWLEGDRKTQVVRANIVHFGAVNEVVESKNKDHRNRSLLQRRCMMSPDDFVARTYLARELERAGEREKAISEIDRAWSTIKSQQSEGKLYNSIVSTVSIRAWLFFVVGRTEEAFQTTSTALEWGVRHPNVLFLHVQNTIEMSGGEMSESSLNEASALLSEAISLKGRVFSDEVMPGATSFAAKGLLGTVNLIAGNYESALSLYDESSAQNTSGSVGHTVGLLGQSEALIGLDRFEEAFVLLKSIVDRSKSISNGFVGLRDAFVLLGLMALKDASYSSIAKFLSAANRTGQQHFLTHRSHIERRLWAATQGIEFLSSLKDKDPGMKSSGSDSATANIAHGEMLFSAGDKMGAQREFIEVLSRDIENGQCWSNLGVTLHSAHHVEEASTALQIALAFDPKSIEARLNSAQVMFSLDRPHSGVESLRCVLESDPDNQTARELLCLLGIESATAGTVEVRPEMSVIMRVSSADGLVAALDWLALSDIPPHVFELVVQATDNIDSVTEICRVPRPFNIKVAVDAQAAIESCQGDIALLLDGPVLLASATISGHLGIHGKSGVATAIAGAVEVSPDSRQTVLSAALAESGLLDNPFFGDDNRSQRGGLPTCNFSVALAALEATGPDALWSGDMEAAVENAFEVPVKFDPRFRAYRELKMDLKGYYRHCLAMGHRHQATGRRFRQMSKLKSIEGRNPYSVDTWMALRGELEVERGVISEVMKSAKVLASKPFSYGQRVSTFKDDISEMLGRIGRHAYSVGQAASASGIEPEAVYGIDKLREGLTSLVVQAKRDTKYIQRSISSARQCSAGPVEMIVVHMGDNQESLKWLNEQSDVTVVKMPHDIGQPAGWNRALEVAQGDSIIFCEEGHTFELGWRDRLLGHLEQWPDIGVVVATPGNPREQGSHEYALVKDMTLFACRRTLIEKIGGFDESLDGPSNLQGSFVYKYDFNIRTKLAGFQVRVALDSPCSKMDHEEPDNAHLEEAWRSLLIKWSLDKNLAITADLAPLAMSGRFDRRRHFVPYVGVGNGHRADLVPGEIRLLAI